MAYLCQTFICALPVWASRAPTCLRRVCTLAEAQIVLSQVGSLQHLTAPMCTEQHSIVSILLSIMSKALRQ